MEPSTWVSDRKAVSNSPAGRLNDSLSIKVSVTGLGVPNVAFTAPERVSTSALLPSVSVSSKSTIGKLLLDSPGRKVSVPPVGT